MKLLKSLSLLAVLLLAGLGSAWAHGSRVGVYVGPYWGYPSPWFYPPYYRQEVIVVQPTPPEPTVYIEQQQEAVRPEPAKSSNQQQYWYYCAAAKGYYPYVKECPGGWQKVLPQPER